MTYDPLTREQKKLGYYFGGTESGWVLMYGGFSPQVIYFWHGIIPSRRDIQAVVEAHMKQPIKRLSISQDEIDDILDSWMQTIG